jgi:hypothetical protein
MYCEKLDCARKARIVPVAYLISVCYESHGLRCLYLNMQTSLKKKGKKLSDNEGPPPPTEFDVYLACG